MNQRGWCWRRSQPAFMYPERVEWAVEVVVVVVVFVSVVASMGCV